MAKKTLKLKIKSCETLVYKVCALFVVLSLITSIKFLKVFHGFNLGILIGCINFRLLVNDFGLSDSKTLLKLSHTIFTFFKLIAIFMICFLLFKLGISIYQIAAGLIFSQIAVIFSFIHNIYLKK